MGPLLATLVVALLGAAAGFPADDEDIDRLGLERPVTPELPRVSECALIALIGEEFGLPDNSNCSRLTPVHPIPTVPESTTLRQLPATGKTEGSTAKPNLDNFHCTSVDYIPVPCKKKTGEFDDPIDVRVSPLDDDCFQYITTCCRKDASSRFPDDPVEPETTSTTTTTTAKVSRPTTASTNKEHEESEDQPTRRSGQCGVRKSGGIGMGSAVGGKLDGDTAGYGEFPWMVAIFRSDEYNDSVTVYQCGGSLIHPQVVLTGAHCVRGLVNLTVVAGEWDMASKSEAYPVQDRKVQQVVFHEEFNNATLANGLALLVLDSPVDTGVESVGLVCLPQPNENMDGQQCVATGWGKNSLDVGAKYKDKLKKVDLPIVARGPCLQALYKTRLGPYFRLHETFLCAGGIPGQDTCKGDGGGPLVCPSRSDPGVYVQAGIVVMGLECNTETPALYVNVARYVHWIESSLRAKGFDIPAVASGLN